MGLDRRTGIIIIGYGAPMIQAFETFAVKAFGHFSFL
jgi:hypothetical protein